MPDYDMNSQGSFASKSRMVRYHRNVRNDRVNARDHHENPTNKSKDKSHRVGVLLKVLRRFHGWLRDMKGNENKAH